jgi:LemA protein
MTAGTIAVLVVLVLLVLVGVWLATSYNGLVRLRNLVQEAWRQIDVELKRRHDLIPNLVETVKAYAAHERETLDAVVRARAAAVSPGSSVQEQAAQEGLLSGALGRLFAVAEAYPALRANENFLALQRELTETEDRIAAGRRFYNANVRGLNTKVESFPSNVVAGMFHFQRADYFEVEDAAQREAPRVAFGSSAPSGPAIGPSGREAIPGQDGEYTVPGSAHHPPGTGPVPPGGPGAPPRP